MKSMVSFLLLNVAGIFFLHAQSLPGDPQQKAIASVIDRYSEARAKRDTLLLKTILSADVDQLVSTGEWRNGVAASVEGMLKSAAGSPGTRTLTIKKIRMIDRNAAIVDCNYEIQKDGNTRKMWSTFIILSDGKVWKISAIRNMLPAP